MCELGAGCGSCAVTWRALWLLQDPGWQCVLLGHAEAGVQPAAPVSLGHPQGDAHQPRQEPAYPGQGAGVPLLPDLSDLRRKKNPNQQLGGAQLLKLATNTLQNPQTVQPLSLKLYRFSRAI